MSMRPLSAWLEGLPEYQALRNSLSEPSSGPIALAVARSIRPLIVAALWQQTRRPTLYVTSSVEASRQAADAVRTLCGIDIAESLSLIRLVEPNTSFYDSVAPVIDVVTQRTAALARLSPMTRGIGVPPLIVASPRAAMHPTMAPGLFSSGTRFIRRDMDLALESMLAHWVSIGYENAPVVDRVGLISRRGGIIDVWSPVYEQPARIELFGDQVESIRWFDPGTQRSGETGDRIAITPLDLAAPSKAPSLVFDYLGEDGLIIIDDEVELRAAWEELENKAERERAILEDAGEVAQVKARLLPFGSWKMFSEGKPAIPRLVLGLAAERSVSAPETLANAFKAAPHFAGQLQPVLDYLKANVTNPVIVVSRQASRLAGLWAETRPGTAAHSDLESVPERGVMFVNGALPGGFIHASGMTLLTDVEIFGYARPDAFTAGRARRPLPRKASPTGRPAMRLCTRTTALGYSAARSS